MKLKKSCILYVCCIVTSALQAQNTEPTVTFLDYYEKKAAGANSGYYVVTSKKNSADIYWERTLYYNDTIQGIVAARGKSRDNFGLTKEGPFVYYHKNGVKWKEGTYVNNEREGEWLTWDEDGKKETMRHYKAGQLVGKNLGWYPNNNLMDSILLDDNGNGTSVEFFEDGAKKSEGGYKQGEKQGSWQYYFSTVKNQKSIDVVYEKDSAISYQCYYENGAANTKDCVFEKEAGFKGGDEGWRNYLVKKLTSKFDVYAKLMRANQVYTTIVRFVVDTDGKLIRVRVETPQNERLDKIAVSIIEQSPKWNPAIQYNLTVKAYRRQPITFVTTD